MSDYLERPLTISQSNHLLKFLIVMFDLGLISEETFADTEQHFVVLGWDTHHLSWEEPSPEWFNSNG